ncbi:MAG: MBL fold metallo-hydrolase [Peptostreptococcaceae bacterium]|nr:MBL fold metallo-hydrolase [Peptostreptococcaceae bacterium]
MSISFCSFSSGSSGNSYLVKSGTTALLIDAGISGRRILEGLNHSETLLEDVKGILVTHEHGDHIKSLNTITKKLPNVIAYANENTWSLIENKIAETKKKIFKTGEIFDIGDIQVKPFNISHDAIEPVGFSFYYEGSQISIVTDTGHITEEIYEEIIDADILVLESNHDVNMLKMCRYPWNVKQRILGTEGHLSNEDAGGILCRLISGKSKKRQVLLAHLSRENNFPEMALQTIKNLLQEADFYIGKNVNIEMILKDQISEIYYL